MSLPKDKTLIWVVNVFDRTWDLRVQIELLRLQYGTAIPIHVYCSAPGLVKGAEHADSVVIVDERDKTNGFRDAMRYTSKIGIGYDIVVSTHAKTWSTDYSAIDKILEKFVEEKSQFAFLDDSPRGAMCDDRADSMYCDLILSTGAMAGCLFYPDDSNRDFPERSLYKKMLENGARMQRIKHMNGGRLSNGDSGQFVFPKIDDGESKLLCGYMSETKWSLLKESNLGYYNHLSSIHEEWRKK